MNSWIVALLFVAGLLLLLLGAGAYGNWSWNRSTEELLARLEASRDRESALGVVSADELRELPGPVRRYLETVLPEDAPIIARARLSQEGEMELNGSWAPFTARQEVVTRRPGFVWNATMRMMKVLRARVHDAYIGGEGLLHGTLFGLVTVAEMSGTPETAEGELLRYLAEAPWYPTALLPRNGLSWRAVDESSAEVTLTDGETVVSMVYHFGEDRLVESVQAESRGRQVGGESIPTPWGGRFWNYRRIDGMLIPTEGEVAWWLPEGRAPYWRGKILDVEYERGAVR